MITVSVHLSDASFASRCPYEDVYVLPCSQTSCSSTPPPDASSVTTEYEELLRTVPIAALASPWLLSPATASTGAKAPYSHTDSFCVERVVLGWRCRICREVERERNYWMEPPEAVTAASPSGARKSERRRAADERKRKQRRRLHGVAPLCSQCYLCPRCGDGLQLLLGEGMTGYYLLCGHCHWRTCTKLENMEAVQAYVTAMGVVKAESLKQWRRAQREANHRLRRMYVEGGSETVTTATDRGMTGGEDAMQATSVSRIAWRTFVTVSRPSALAARNVKEGAAAAVGRVTAVPVVPVLNFDGAASQREGNEAAVVADVLRPGTHPAVALEKLRNYYAVEQQAAMMRQRCSFLSADRCLPSYVTTVTAKAVVPHPLPSSDRSAFLKGREPDTWGKPQARSCEEHTDSGDDETQWFAANQRLQFGLHSDCVTASMNAEEHLSLLQSGTTLVEATSRGVAGSSSSRTGLSMITPGRHGGGAALSASKCAPPQPGRIPHHQLEALLSDTANKAFLSSLRSYYLRPAPKEVIEGTVCYEVAPPDVAGVASASTATACPYTRSIWVLDRHERDDEALANIFSAWIEMAAEAAAKGVPPRRPIPVFHDASVGFASARVLPVCQVVHATAGALSIHFLNLSEQDLIVVDCRLARQRGGPYTLQSAEGAPQWVRLVPRFSADERRTAEAITAVGTSGNGEAEPPVCPPRIAARCARSTDELKMVIASDDNGGADATGSASFVGLQLTVITYIPSGRVGRQVEKENAPAGQYHRVTFGVSLVW